MAKSILVSIKPEYVEKILNHSKTIEIRKTMPKCELPCKVYIYCTKEKLRTGKYVYVNEPKIRKKFGVADHWCDYKTDYITINEGTPQLAYKTYLAKGKVVAEFTLKKVEKFSIGSLRCDDIEVLSCVSYKQMVDYFFKPEELDGNHFKFGYAWHIDNLKTYDKPKELSEFGQKCTNANEIHCRDCKYVKWDTCCKIMAKPLKRPPQSWCYVEELE